MFLNIAKLGSKCQRERHRIVDDASYNMLMLVVELHVEAGRLLYELWDRRIDLVQAFHVIRGENTLIGHIQRHERHWNSAMKDDMCGMWVDVNVELCQR